jgi:phosphatidylinositol alpha-1,6-mannosyltransferase
VLRALWVTNDFPPRVGGIEQFLGQLLARREPAGTRVLTARWPGSAEHDAALPYPVERVGRRPLLPCPRLRSRVRREAHAFGADVVVFGAAWPLGETASSLAQPTFALSHGHEAGMARIGLGPLVARVARRVDALSVISEFTRSALEPWTRETTVHLLSPGVDTTVFHPSLDGSGVRARHGIGRDAPLVVCVSRLVPRKGQDVLVEAWPRVRARVPGARLLLVGTGPLERRLRRSLAALGLQECVTLAGQVPGRDLPGYHAAADLFAMPCRTRYGGLDVEGLGIVYLEAQACGVPVVAGRSGGAPEALVDGVTGRTVDGSSAAAVADVVAALLTDEAGRAEMGAAGRAFVERRYAWEVMAARLDAIIRSVVASG